MTIVAQRKLTGLVLAATKAWRTFHAVKRDIIEGHTDVKLELP